MNDRSSSVFVVMVVMILVESLLNVDDCRLLSLNFDFGILTVFRFLSMILAAFDHSHVCSVHFYRSVSLCL